MLLYMDEACLSNEFQAFNAAARNFFRRLEINAAFAAVAAGRLAAAKKCLPWRVHAQQLAHDRR